MNTTKLQLRMKTAIASTAAILALIGVVATVGCSADSNATDVNQVYDDVYAKCIQGTPIQKFEVCMDREQDCSLVVDEDGQRDDDEDGQRDDAAESARLACRDKCRVEAGCKADQKRVPGYRCDDDTEAKCEGEADKADKAAK